MLREIFEYMVSNGLAMWIDGEIDKKLLDDDTSINKTGGDSDEDDEDNAYERAYARYEQQHHKQQKSSGKSNSAAAKSGIIVYWRRPQEWATLITDWVDRDRAEWVSFYTLRAGVGRCRTKTGVSGIASGSAVTGCRRARTARSRISYER